MKQSRIKKQRSPLRGGLKSRILGGIFAILPLFLTFAIVRFLLEFVGGFTRPLLDWLAQHYFSEAFRANFVSYQNAVIFPLSVVLALLLIYVVGLLAERGFRQLFEGWVGRLPFIASLYSSIRQVVDVLGASDNKKGMFERVCLFQMTSDSSQILGFLTSVFSDEGGQKFGTIYVPMPPNPTSGMLYVAPIERIRRLDMSADTAMKMIVSGGLLTPLKIRTNSIDLNAM